MRISSRTRRRILAIDPTHRGFGYVVLEPELLVDWGICQVRADKTRRTIDRVSDLVRRLTPDVLVIEDIDHPDCRRGERVRELLHALESIARTWEIRLCRVPVAKVRQRYSGVGATNKDAVARDLVIQYPELESVLPRRRRTWMPEHEGMSVFDALAMAGTFHRNRPSED